MREREVVQWLMHNDNKKRAQHYYIRYMYGSVHAHIPTAQCDNNRNCVYLRSGMNATYNQCSQCSTMINDNNNNNKSLRSTTAILHLLRARWEILFSLGYLPTSIYLYISFQRQQDIKNGVQIQNTPNGQSKAIKMGWRAGTKKKGG